MAFQSQISFDPLCNILMPHVWLILLLCCCLGFPGLQFACLPRLHALVLLGTDKKLSKRGLAYKVGIFLCLYTALFEKKMNKIWYLFYLFMFSSPAHRVRMVSAHQEVSARLHRLVQTTPGLLRLWGGRSHVCPCCLSQSIYAQTHC